MSKFRTHHTLTAALAGLALASTPATADATLTLTNPGPVTTPLDVSAAFDHAGAVDSGTSSSFGYTGYTPYYYTLTFSPDPSANGDVFEVDGVNLESTDMASSGYISGSDIIATLYPGTYTGTDPLTVDTSTTTSAMGTGVLEIDADGNVAGQTVTGDMSFQGADQTLMESPNFQTVADPTFSLEIPADASAAPEPSQAGTLALIVLGLGGLMARARRRA